MSRSQIITRAIIFLAQYSLCCQSGNINVSRFFWLISQSQTVTILLYKGLRIDQRERLPHRRYTMQNSTHELNRRSSCYTVLEKGHQRSSLKAYHYLSRNSTILNINSVWYLAGYVYKVLNRNKSEGTFRFYNVVLSIV